MKMEFREKTDFFLIVTLSASKQSLRDDLLLDIKHIGYLTTYNLI